MSRNEPAKILLVDDQPSRLLSYRAILEPLGETLVEARSGTEALGRLMMDEFAVILLDVNMPGMDGFETASVIRQHPRFEKTPIIFVSAVNLSDFDRLRGYKAGAVDYVPVPVIPEILASKVLVLVELFRKTRDLRSLNANLESMNAELAAANEALRIEKTREVYKLNETLRTANAELAAINLDLQTEIGERRRAEERLQDADRRKNEFLATLAHELRNPLAPIQSALSVRRMARESAAGIDELQQIMERQMRQMVRLTDDLLDISRITRDNIELRREFMNVAEALDAAVETARPLIDQAGQTFVFRIDDEPLFVLGDSQRLAQVFANLLNNASRYTDASGTIRLDAGCEGGMAVVSVHDNGIGIAPEEMSKVFELFSQVDSSLERSRGGLGIGLTLVRKLVDMHGGTVEGLSEGPGRGSTFVVRLPLCEPPQTVPSAVPPDGTRSRAALRALVVDDNVDAADMLALSLQMMGHEVRVVYDPLVVEEIVRSFDPDIVFMDVGMPHLNGFELAKRLRNEPWGRRSHLVALTGLGQDQDRRSSMESGFDEHLIKPADLESIERSCLAARRARTADGPEHECST